MRHSLGWFVAVLSLFPAVGFAADEGFTPQRLSEMAGQVFARADADGSGGLTREEAVAARRIVDSQIEAIARKVLNNQRLDISDLLRGEGGPAFAAEGEELKPAAFEQYYTQLFEAADKAIRATHQRQTDELQEAIGREGERRGDDFRGGDYRGGNERDRLLWEREALLRERERLIGQDRERERGREGEGNRDGDRQRAESEARRRAELEARQRYEAQARYRAQLEQQQRAAQQRNEQVRRQTGGGDRVIQGSRPTIKPGVTIQRKR